jgi:hypothetical protein
VKFVLTISFGAVRWWGYQRLVERGVDRRQQINATLADPKHEKLFTIEDSKSGAVVQLEITNNDVRNLTTLSGAMLAVHKACGVLESEKVPTINLVLRSLAYLERQFSDAKSSAFGRAFLEDFRKRIQVCDLPKLH